ncbi:MAG: J domain-containing protein, partial [Pirellulales bacterium]|nr:J domain-containing protein [Pirellulales bacterium]
EAVLGAKIDVPTPWGAIALTVPAGTSSGKRLRVKGHGVSGPEEQRGDLFAVLRIVVPEEVDESSAELIRQFTSQNQMDPRCELDW